MRDNLHNGGPIMKLRPLSILICSLALLSVPVAGQCTSYAPSPPPVTTSAKVGLPAPDFSLEAVVGIEKDKEFATLKLADYKGKWLVLFFYPADFTFVCPTEIKGFNDALTAFRKLDAEIVGASTDSKYSHLAWIKRGDLGNLRYPLLADF